MHNVADIVTDEELDSVWGNSDFGSISKRDLLKNTLLKCATKNYPGSTAVQIATELRLIGKNLTLTKWGKRYLFAAFNIG